MKEFTNLVLCDYRSKCVDVRVSATLADGTLRISGQDLGPYVEDYWGDSDYEYWYSFDEENTARLLAAIHGEDDPETALLHAFSGEHGCSELRSLCARKKIEYSFFSYA